MKNMTKKFVSACGRECPTRVNKNGSILSHAMETHTLARRFAVAFGDVPSETQTFLRCIIASTRTVASAFFLALALPAAA